MLYMIKSTNMPTTFAGQHFKQEKSRNVSYIGCYQAGFLRQALRHSLSLSPLRKTLHLCQTNEIFPLLVARFLPYLCASFIADHGNLDRFSMPKKRSPSKDEKLLSFPKGGPPHWERNLRINRASTPDPKAAATTTEEGVCVVLLSVSINLTRNGRRRRSSRCRCRRRCRRHRWNEINSGATQRKLSVSPRRRCVADSSEHTLARTATTTTASSTATSTIYTWPAALPAPSATAHTSLHNNT